MELKQVWMSRDTRKQSRYSLRTLGGILGIAMLALVLVLGGTALGFMLGWPMRLVSVGLWLGVTVLLVALAPVSYTHLDVYKRQGYRFSYPA